MDKSSGSGKFRCKAEGCDAKVKLFDSLEALIETHWKKNCAGVSFKCKDCDGILYGYKFKHDCAESVAEQLEKGKNRLKDLK